MWLNAMCKYKFAQFIFRTFKIFLTSTNQSETPQLQHQPMLILFFHKHSIQHLHTQYHGLIFQQVSENKGMIY